MRHYAVHIHLAHCGPDRSKRNPKLPRDRWKMERQLERIYVRAEAVRGRVMNLAWLDWFDHWGEVHTRLCGRVDECPHTQYPADAECSLRADDS